MEILGINSLRCCNSHTSLFDLTSLRKARDINTMGRRYTVTLLYGLAGETDSLGISARKEMSDRHRHIEYRVLWILRAHVDGLFANTQWLRLIGPPSSA